MSRRPCCRRRRPRTSSRARRRARRLHQVRDELGDVLDLQRRLALLVELLHHLLPSRLRTTMPSVRKSVLRSFTSIEPLPSLSNRLNASFSSSTSSRWRVLRRARPPARDRRHLARRRGDCPADPLLVPASVWVWQKTSLSSKWRRRTAPPRRPPPRPSRACRDGDEPARAGRCVRAAALALACRARARATAARSPGAARRVGVARGVGRRAERLRGGLARAVALGHAARQHDVLVRRQGRRRVGRAALIIMAVNAQDPFVQWMLNAPESLDHFLSNAVASVTYLFIGYDDRGRRPVRSSRSGSNCARAHAEFGARGDRGSRASSSRAGVADVEGQGGELGAWLRRGAWRSTYYGAAFAGLGERERRPAADAATTTACSMFGCAGDGSAAGGGCGRRRWRRRAGGAASASAGTAAGGFAAAPRRRSRRAARASSSGARGERRAVRAGRRRQRVRRVQRGAKLLAFVLASAEGWRTRTRALCVQLDGGGRLVVAKAGEAAAADRVRLVVLGQAASMIPARRAACARHCGPGARHRRRRRRRRRGDGQLHGRGARLPRA